MDATTLDTPDQHRRSTPQTPVASAARHAGAIPPLTVDDLLSREVERERLRADVAEQALTKEKATVERLTDVVCDLAKANLELGLKLLDLMTDEQDDGW